MEVLTSGNLCREVDDQFANHLVVGVADHACTRCGDALFIIVPASAQSAQAVSLLCQSEGTVQLIHDSSFDVQQLVEDRVRLINDGSGVVEASRRLARVVAAKEARTPSAVQQASSIKESTSTRSSSIDVPVPQGFRTVSWIRQHEAELIVSSYDNERPFTLTADDGSPVFETQYFAADSPEAMRFKAQVLGIRHRGNGTRNLGWIRREEAKAVLQAYDEERSVDFLHTSFGRGGRVEFFGADSQAAQTYRSQTRLLRRNA